ncbi:MAG: dTDP-4-dehydrorhamnose reductase [Rhodanobacteraceae bacterium]|nr:dTDP-4-dehydrorhamnose reductase [Rhodanobacteraceae bacterium]
MTILLLGADGQVGFELHRALAPIGRIVATTRTGLLPGGIDCARCDLGDHAALDALIETTRPNWIVNAAAYTAVDHAEAEPDLAHRINGDALTVIGTAAKRVGSRVVHYSTDYVFNGTATLPWREDASTAPLSAYGRSKLAGETALRESAAAHLIFRTAWVYGPRGTNFLRTMLRLARERERLTVVADQIGTPTPARLIAQTTALVLYALRNAANDDARFGTYHLTANGHTNWHGFASRIIELAHGSGLIERKPEVVAITTAEFPTKATRPAYAVLDTTKLQSTFGLALPDWTEGLARAMGELNA